MLKYVDYLINILEVSLGFSGGVLSDSAMMVYAEAEILSCDGFACALLSNSGVGCYINALG